MIIALSVYDNAVDTRMPAFKHADDVCKSIWQLLSQYCETCTRVLFAGTPWTYDTIYGIAGI